jgi:hypothetical protein
MAGHTGLVLRVHHQAATNMCGATDVRQGVDPCIKGRASVELVLRQLMRFPNAPAVVLVHAYLH